jgi:hypothetical protein
MRIKQPKVLFSAGGQKRPKQDIPTEAARIKARMARVSVKSRDDVAAAKADSKPRS